MNCTGYFHCSRFLCGGIGRCQGDVPGTEVAELIGDKTIVFTRRSTRLSEQAPLQSIVGTEGIFVFIEQQFIYSAHGFWCYTKRTDNCDSFPPFLPQRSINQHQKNFIRRVSTRFSVSIRHKVLGMSMALRKLQHQACLLAWTHSSFQCTCITNPIEASCFLLSSKIVCVLVLLLHGDQLVVEAQIHIVSEFPAHKCLKILAGAIETTTGVRIELQAKRIHFVEWVENNFENAINHQTATERKIADAP